MPTLGVERNALWGLAFVNGAMAMADFIAKACSSPQTMQINAHARAGTLMQWVNIGLVEGAVIVGIAMYFDRKIAEALFWGALTEGVISYGEYVYAKRAGLASAAPGTENYA
jgi:hypothetical protein